MLGYDSQRRLKNLLVAVGEGERDLEFARSRLCQIPDFAPLGLFERIDRDGSGRISYGEILDFLRNNQVFHVNSSEASDLIAFFDNDGNGRLDYQEFSQMVLPCEDNLLRNRTLARPSRRIGRYDFLPRDIEQAATDIFEKEVAFQRRIELLKRDLAYAYDYSPNACFNTLDRRYMREVDTVQLGDFLRSQGHYASEMELIAIIRRIDTDGDATIDYPELAEYLRPLIPGPPPYPPPSPPRRAYSPPSRSSPLRSSGSPARAKSADKFSTPPKRVSFPGPSPSRPSPGKPILGLREEDELIHSLKTQCSLEAELERAKINLANCRDFNLYDMFNIFDPRRMGTVNLYDLQAGLRDIGVFASHDECNLIMTRYDDNGDGRLSAPELDKAFLAFDTYYAQIVRRRPSNYVPRPIRPDNVWSYLTACEFRSMCQTHIRCENAAEHLRQMLNANPYFNANQAFNSLDLDGDNSITATEVRRMIESRGYFVGQKECEQVIAKMDTNKDGKISYNEFASESRNKSPARR